MNATARIVDDLAAQLPSGAVSVASADRLAACDMWPRHIIAWEHGQAPELPLAVLFPESVEDLVTIVRHARRQRLGLVAYGAGSSVVGGASPRDNQVVVDFRRMARIRTIDAAARLGTAEVGIVGELWERHLNRAGLTQGHFPSSIYCSTLGGWIAARSAGQMSSRYGKIEDQVMGAVVVMADGTIVREPAKAARSALLEELIGSEGTLGFFAEATVRLHPLPQSRQMRGFDFPDLHRALACARAWLDAGINPSVVRLYDPIDTLLHRSTHGKSEPHDRGPNWLAWVGAQAPRLVATIADTLGRSCRAVLGLEGDERLVGHELRLALDIAERHGAKDKGTAPGDAWLEKRYAISYRQSNAFRANVAVDTMEVGCPWEKVLDIYQAVRRAGQNAGAQVIAHFSHVYLEGASIYFTFAMPLRVGVDGYDRLWRDCLTAALSQGANVSHHHGAGRAKAAAMLARLGGAAALLEDLRSRLDPSGIMNSEALRSLAQAPNITPPHLERAGTLRAVAPGDSLSSVEERLRREGSSLGPIAELFPERTVLAAARADLLWRHNPQLATLERALGGVDARTSSGPTLAPVTPRAATGPDLREILLTQDVERLWLRTTPLRSRRFAKHQVAARDLSALAQASLGRDLTLSAQPAANGFDVVAACLDGERGTLPVSELGFSTHTPTSPAPCREPMLFSCRWDRFEAVVGCLSQHGAPWSLPFIDAVGVVGVVDLEALSVAARDTLGRELGLLEATLEPRREPFAAPDPIGEERPALQNPAGPTPATPLRLEDFTAQLDNCAYCPKLCRFSCAVGNEGGEALTPRQLVLTARLDSHGQRRLDADTAERLFACVDCGGCQSFCEHGNDVAAILQEARAELFEQDATPPAMREYLRQLRDDGRPADRPLSDWPGLGLPAKEGPAPVALFLGCQGTALDPRPAEAALAAAQRLGEVALVPASAGCCGHPLWRWGDRQGFAERARAVGEAVAALGASHLVVDDPGCAAALSMYREVGVELPPVCTTLSLLAGPPPSVPAGVVLHEPCMQTRRLDAPPNSSHLQAAGPGSVVGAEAGCCGGMLLPVYSTALAERVAVTAVTDLCGAGASRIMTSSPTCRRRLRAAGATVDDVLTHALGKPSESS